MTDVKQLLGAIRPSSEKLIDQLPYTFLKKHCIIPLELKDNEVVIATIDPAPLLAIDEIQLILNKPVRVVYTDKQVLLECLQRIYGDREGKASDFLRQLKSNEEVLDIEQEDFLENQDNSPVVKFLNLILKEAVEERASDIHFEPVENSLKIRYRVDGVLHTRHQPPSDFKTALITRIKVLAKLDIAEHRLPQDGRIKLHIGGRDIDMRVSTIPVVNGERVVLRILDKRNSIVDITGLGMPKEIEKAFKDIISFPEGILLVTGPTGSGKTTTLYSALKHLSGHTLNIMTIEDPPEYKLPNISQLAVKPKIGLTFARGLKHLLRQDPDILMIGEIRDVETAEIAIQAALTGHLVVSTLHTNDALSAIPRLIDMGIEPYLLSATVIGVVAQRLVRKICEHCKHKVVATSEEIAFLNKLGISSEAVTLYQGKGCEHCLNSGYKYRQGIYELVKPDIYLKSEIANGSPHHVLKEQAEKSGFETLVYHGIALALAGDTTLSEVFRVTKKMD